MVDASRGALAQRQQKAVICAVGPNRCAAPIRSSAATAGLPERSPKRCPNRSTWHLGEPLAIRGFSYGWPLVQRPRLAGFHSKAPRAGEAMALSISPLVTCAFPHYSQPIPRRWCAAKWTGLEGSRSTWRKSVVREVPVFRSQLGFWLWSQIRSSIHSYAS